MGACSRTESIFDSNEKYKSARVPHVKLKTNHSREKNRRNMSDSKPFSGAKEELSDKMKELDQLMLKTQGKDLIFKHFTVELTCFQVENYEKTAAVLEEQLRVFKTENTELQEYIKNIEKRGYVSNYLIIIQ
jgi:hypothetical protein